MGRGGRGGGTDRFCPRADVREDVDESASLWEEQEVLGYNRLIDHVGVHGQKRLTEALNKDSLVRQKEYLTESSSKSSSLTISHITGLIIGHCLYRWQESFASGKWGQPHVSTEVDLRRKHGHGKGIMQKEGRHSTCPEMFQMTQARTAPDGSVMWSNEQSRQVMDQMTQLMNPTPSEESDGTAHLAVLTLEEAFRQVFGRDRPRQIQCGGRTQTLRSWYKPSKGGSSSNTAYQRLLQEQSQQKFEIS
ncbi:hypothetical protein Taro_026013 [Colocasia esculenta]|uniref:Uncharacterized protein n=1 Tax=Colocasia esculenta TaxID=4460 RepID=A0A843VQ06_COLES|nr:hypothetical protein [Colocasia esculenta]